MDLGPTTTTSTAAMAIRTSDLNPTTTTSTSFPCPHSDPSLLHSLSHLLLHSLATAAVDSTAGDPFHSPSSVAVPLRRDLIDHLSSLSLSFTPLSLSNPNPSPNLDDPLDVLSFLSDDFAASRRSLLGRLSSWLLSDARDDKIDDFVDEMQASNFWPLSRRETLAAVILKNVDYKNRFHCAEQFSSEIELENHKKDCKFRPVSCRNDGCKVKYCKMQEEEHDGVCVYKVMECEQGCGERVVRRGMDRHCVTACRMKMVNCPFYQLGCRLAFPQCRLREHCEELLRVHLVCVMGVREGEGFGEEELKRLTEKMDKVLYFDSCFSILLYDIDDACENLNAEMIFIFWKLKFAFKSWH